MNALPKPKPKGNNAEYPCSNQNRISFLVLKYTVHIINVAYEIECINNVIEGIRHACHYIC